MSAAVAMGSPFRGSDVACIAHVGLEEQLAGCLPGRGDELRGAGALFAAGGTEGVADGVLPA